MPIREIRGINLVGLRLMIRWIESGGMRFLNPKAEYVVKNGKPTAIILPLDEYEELLGDLHDLAAIASRKDEPLIPLDEVKRRLKRR